MQIAFCNYQCYNKKKMINTFVVLQSPKILPKGKEHTAVRKYVAVHKKCFQNNVIN